LEDSGQIHLLGKTMLAQSLAALHRWNSAGFDVPTVSVNFSATELRDPNLPDHLKFELDRLGLTAQRLHIEILESVIASQTDDVLRRNVTDLAALGCRIDIDDFGTGNASITTLQVLPIHRVKIDQSFVKGADTSHDLRKLLAAVLAMTEQLNIEALAEGVETPREQGVLRDLGCPYAQGFLFAPPMPLPDFETWVRTQQAPVETASPHQIRRVK
jgi:EAL domain-containing protein (putative c-di-GMP-specific phosphodiesterase class I)